MRGTKRVSGSDSKSLFQTKRVFAGSQNDSSRPESSRAQQQQVSALSLDVQRAELSRQHVRALNTQFASWVQSQLRNHPDELWQDGAQDYLNHASNIMEKFDDVVNWLRQNVANGEIGSVSGSEQKNSETDSKGVDKPYSDTQENILGGATTIDENNKFGGASPSTTGVFGGSWGFGGPKSYESKQIVNNLSSDKANNTPASTTATFGGTTATFQGTTPTVGGSTPSFGCSWSSGISKNSPFSVGLQTSVAGTRNMMPVTTCAANEQQDAEDASEQPGSPSVRKTEEKGIMVVLEVKCKLYVKSNDPANTWTDIGTGQLSIKCKGGITKGTKESKPTIIIRNDVGKVLLNALLYPGIKTTSLQKNAIVAILHSSGDGDDSNSVEARTFLLRTKTGEDRDKLAAAIFDYAPAA